MKLFLAIFGLGFLSMNLFGQDTTKYSWPISPVNVQKQVGGTFGEYRSTSVEGHYHNATDISGGAGTPVYAVLAGTVAVAYDDGTTGYDSYVRINSVISGSSKLITYYHTRPLPNVTVGQSISLGQQISTIAIDHVHLIEYRFGTSIIGTQINPLRPGGGLTPYVDTWKPFIRYVKFLRDNSEIVLPAANIGGKIDIIAHVEEVSGTSSSTFNNGTYELGYKVLSEDGLTTVYNPPDNGLRYRYYNLPANQYVNVNYYKPESNTSQHVYILTNGTGANAVATSQAVTNNYFDADAFPYGNYKVLVFTYDSRGNGDSVYIPITTAPADLVAPQAPLLKSIIRDSLIYFSMNWMTPPDGDLHGYRVYYSTDGTTYQLRESENTLTALLTKRTYTYGLPTPLYLRIHSVDTANPVNVSLQSDVYGIRNINDGKKILIVDGFNRFLNGGSYNKSYHDFIIRFAESGSFSFETAHHSTIRSGSINIQNYQTVFWMSGDEDPAAPIFDGVERNAFKNFLESGGNLFVSGSEIAENLYRNAASDSSLIAFMQNYFKLTFADGDANLNNAIISDSTGVFSAALMPFGHTSQGSPYLEDAPDVIAGEGDAVEFMKYSLTKTAGIYYSGLFGNSSQPGKLVYLGFPFETIGSKPLRTQFMTDLLNFFYPVNNLGNEENDIMDKEFTVYQNYPNPFNPQTKIEFYNPKSERIKVPIFNSLGELIYSAADNVYPTGMNEIQINFNDFSSSVVSGVYFARFETTSVRKSIKLIYLK